MFLKKLFFSFYVLKVKNVSGDPETFVNDRNDHIGVSQPMVLNHEVHKPTYLPR